MTPSQFRQWSFQNSQPDQWWLCLDSVTEEIPVTVAEIEERLKSGQYSTVQAIHVSLAGMENAPWVEVTMPPVMIAPPAMLPPVAAATPMPAALNANAESSKPDETLGILLLVLPLTGIFLIWYSPVAFSLQLAALTVVCTAILVGIEANKLGIGKDKKFDKNGREKRQTGPVGWAIFVMLVWLVGFPSYMYWRSRYGAKNMLIGGIGVAILFLVITSLIGAMPFPTNRLVKLSQREYQEIDLGIATEQTNSSLEEIHKQVAIDAAELESATSPSASNEPNSTLPSQTTTLQEINLQVARDAEEQFQIVWKNGTEIEASVQAGIVAAAYLQAKDETNYKKWKNIESTMEAAAELKRQGYPTEFK